MDTLYVVASIVFICGLLLLFVIQASIPIEEVALDNISSEYVSTTGRVLSVTNLDEVTFLTIQDSCILEVVVFDNVLVFEGQEVTVSGKRDGEDGSFIADVVE